MNFNVEDMASIVNQASKTLQNKALGGVTRDSAMTAIQRGVTEALNRGEELVGKVQKELNNLKISSANDLVRLANEKDTVILNTKDAAQKAVQSAKQSLKDAMRIQSSETILPNNNIQVRKFKPKTGTVMVKEMTQENKTVRYEVTTMDGQLRRSNLNPVSGKPINTYTDTKFDAGRGLINEAPSANGARLIEYNAEGNAVSTKNVNNKKIKAAKPQKAGKAELLEKDGAKGILKLRQAYSDGSYEIINYSERKQDILEKTYFNAKNQKVSQVQNSFNDRGELYQINTQKYNLETGNYKETSVEYLFEKSKSITKYNDEGKVIESIVNHNGFTKVVKAKVNEYGLIQDKNLPVRIIYPKDSPIKESNIEFIEQYMPKTETLTMKDGSTAILSRFDGNYNPREIRIIPKNVSSENPEYVINDWKEMGAWCEKYGKPSHRILNDYYNNYI